MDVDMSLDDFIQKKGIKLNRGSRSGGFRGRQRFSGTKRNENNSLRSILKSNGNFNNKSRGGGVSNKGPVGSTIKGRISIGGRIGPPVKDARLKIIQKTRKKITDAREKLAEIAKQSDARLKLKRIQEKRTKTAAGRQKRRGGGKVPLILRSVDPSVTNPSILISEDSDEEIMSGGTMPVLQRTIINKSNNIVMNRLGSRNMIDDDDGGFEIGGNGTDGMLTDIVNDRMYSSGWPPVSRSAMPRLISQQSATSQLKIVTHNEQLTQARMQDRWEVPAAALLNRQQVKRTFGVTRSDMFEGDDDALRSHRNSRISQEMKARLDTPAVPVSRSMGVLSQQPASAMQPIGHRIVVSNLQASVTHEDIKELFEDIGPLVTSHVVRPGTAEVIYVNQKDAIAAVEAYHNRQLDGQPMKCLLVNSRPSNMTSSARTGAKYPSSTKSAVLPDISAIHKALFNK